MIRSVGQDSSWFPQNFSFPKFSKSTMVAIETKSIRKAVRVEIVESLGHQIWVHTAYPSSMEYTSVCYMLIQKYPVLTDSVGNGIVRLSVLQCVL